MKKRTETPIVVLVAILLTAFTAWPLGCGIFICVEMRTVSFWLSAAIMEFILAAMLGFIAITVWTFVWK